MSDAEIKAEKEQYEEDLNRLTEAYMKSNSIRFLWKELIRRQGG